MRYFALQRVDETGRTVVSLNSNCSIATNRAISASARVDGTELAMRQIGKVATRAAAPVGKAALQERGDGSVVGIARIALKNDVTVPFKSVTFERAEDQVSRTGLLTGRVYVFNSQQPASVVGACLQITCHRCDK